MKHNIKLFFLAVIFSTACMWGCRDGMLDPDPWTYAIVNGDTVKTVQTSSILESNKIDKSNRYTAIVGEVKYFYQNPFENIQNPENADLTSLGLQNTNYPKVLAIGGSLSSGVINNGYYNEGIITSFPNIIARQMGAKDFKLPLFKPDQYNGISRKEPTSFNPTGGPLPKLNFVTNNTAGRLSGETKIEFEKLDEFPDSYTVPNMMMLTLDLNKSIADSYIEFSTHDNIGGGLKERFGTENSLSKFIDIKSPDFVILEMGFNELLDKNYGGLKSSGGTFLDNTTPKIIEIDEKKAYNPTGLHVKLLKKLRDTGVKNGVIIKAPFPEDLPRFSSLTIKDLKRSMVYSNVFWK